MSSLHISILCILLTIIFADNKTFYFTKSNYDLWCQENILSNSLFLYPNRIPIGIYRTSNIKSVTYHLIDDNNNGLFQIKSKRLADFYFLIVNITRPFDINREYQDVYSLRIRANIVTTQENQSEQAEIRLHVADSNDNDGVFDMDVYEQNYTQPLVLEQSLIHFHASDADEIQHAQILYELASSLNETFSLHPFTGDLYLTTKENLQSTYEFDIFAYDRYRRRLVDNNMKTKAHVKLNFNLPKTKFQKLQTILNKTIEFNELISSYEIKIIERKSIHLLNMHQPILTIDVKPHEKFFEIFLLNNSSSNTMNLFLDQNNIYLNKYLIEEYNLQFLICFNHRQQCQYTNYRFIPFMDFNLYEFHFKPMKTIELDENLPVDSFITRIQLEYKNLYSEQALTINYKLLNDEKDFQFYMNSKTGILRLAERLEYRNYSLDIQANIHLFNRRYSIETTIQIQVQEINKHRPIFRNNTPTELFQLPYQFQAFDLDQNKQTNGRITYRLWNCSNSCPFIIDPTNGTLMIGNREKFLRENLYHLQIIVYDWGQPISLESSLNIHIYQSSKFNKRDLTRTRAYSRRWRKKSTTTSLTTTINTIVTETSLYTTTLLSNTDTVYLNIGFRENFTSYSLSEDAQINTIIDHLKIDYNSFPLNINNEKDNLFFYTINDTNVPFIIDQNTKVLKLIDKLDREKQDKYIFEIELKLKSIYSMKLQELYNCQTNNSSTDFQYTNKYYHKMLVSISITDVNDNIPKCNSFHTRIQLNENEIQKNIYQVQAYDPDLGENGTVRYSLFDYNQYFSIDALTGQIDCIKSIDHEEFPSIDLHIIASDQSSQPQLQSLCTTVHIIINDINDNTPQFSSDNYTFNLFSDMPRYSIFGQIYAIDQDENDQLIYSLSPNPYVIINKFTGHLRLKHSLHRLTDQKLNVTIQVSDGQHKNETLMSIDVKSFPDAQEPIVLSEPGYSLTINESLVVGSIITNVYRRFQIVASTIDFIEIVHDQMKLPFAIDQEGYLRLTHSLIGLSKSSYWLAIRLTRYRAHPPHTFVHIHLSIRQENFYLPQCVDVYQNVKVYDYLIQHPFARIEAISLNKNSLLQYSINDPEKIFSIDQRTGFIQLLTSIHNNRRLKSDYLLTIKAFDTQYKLSVDCYLNIHLIRRRQLIPKFISSPNYDISLPEIQRNTGRLRQRLFQIVALLDNQVYEKKLEIRYRIVDSNQHFIINRQTGYIAAKQPLKAYTTFEFNVEAFTVAYRDDILFDGNENEEEEHSSRGKWRVVSPRVSLPIKIRILPTIPANKSLLSTVDSTINIDLLSTTEVGSIILQLGMNNRLNNTQWFIMTGHIRDTRYFHVDFQTGHLILLRPIDDLINQTNKIELRINVTNDWINMNTIKVIVRLINNRIPSIEFPQTDYYTSVSKSIPIGAEIARLTIDNAPNDCTYSIDSVERIKSKDLFRINPHTGSVTVINSLENSPSPTHLLTIIYRCEHNYHIAHTVLHINILDEKNLLNQTNKSYRFSQEHYLIIFETSLVKDRKRDLMNFELINNDDMNERMKPDVKILQGDPLGLFSIDSSSQSLVLLDESQSRSYIYPLNLTVIDTSQTEFISTNVIIFISNIGIHFPCPAYLKHSPYLFTYESLPLKSIDTLTGQEYQPYQSLTVRAFDSFTPINGEASNQAECIIDSHLELSTEMSIKSLDFIFDNELYSGYINDSFGPSAFIYNNEEEPLHIQLKNSFNLTDPFDLTYHLLNQTNINFFQLDPYAGLIKYNSLDNLLREYSFLIYAKYQSLITFTRLNLLIHHKTHSEKKTFQSIYEFKLSPPLVNNYTIGYLNKTSENFTILNEHILPMISIDQSGRLFIRNRTLILTNGNFYDFLVQVEDAQIIRIQILISSQNENISECQLNRLNYYNDKQFIGFIEMLNSESICYGMIQQSFYLLNYNELFLLDREHGLLRYRNENQKIDEDLLLLIQLDHSRCLITIEKSIAEFSYMMIRNGSQLQMEMKEQYHIEKSSGQIKLSNGTLVNYDIIPSQSPIFSRKFYEFSFNISNTNNHTIFVGQIVAQPYNFNRSHLVYQFLHEYKHYLLNPDNGIIEYIPNESYNNTMEQFQIIARDLIYQQNTIINVTLSITYSNKIPSSPSIYDRTVSEMLPPGSVIFQSNLPMLQTLADYNRNLFTINPNSGEITLLNYLTDKFYSFEIHSSPMNEISIVKLSINDYNNHPPTFLNPPLNLSLSSSQTFLTKFSANDLDLKDNLHLKYYLLDKDQQQIFSINQTNGILTLHTNNSLTKDFYQLNIGVSDGSYLTKTYLQIQFFNYSKHSPRFSSDEYVFQYDQSKDILGQISAYDVDVNDQLSYQLYLQPNGIEINQQSGLITMNKTLFQKSIFEFFASAIDLANQITYTKIKLIYSIQPKFTSYLYYITLTPSQMVVPLEIFQFELVDLFNQPLKSAKYQLKNQTNLFEINENRLFLKEYLIPSDTYSLNINAYWKNFILQTSVQIIFAENIKRLDKKFYEFTLEKNLLNDNFLIENFQIENLTMKILPTPLTQNECTENFYIKNNQLFFKTFPILSDLCFFELQLIDNLTISSSQVKILLMDVSLQPKFSSKIYSFYVQNNESLLRVFAKSSNSVQYKLEKNPYGLIINQTNGIIRFKYGFDLIKHIDRIQLSVYAIDEKMNVNDTAVVEISFNERQKFEIPKNDSEVSFCPNLPISLSDQSLPGTVIQDIRLPNTNNSNNYYILSGDNNGLFAINNLGQLYLTSPILNQTSEEYFHLIILISSSSSLSYCRTNISITRTPKWSYFICPAVPIQWVIREESPIGTILGTVKDALFALNNSSQLIDQIQFKFNNSNLDAQSFLLNSQTGVITSNARLDYEQQIFYSFSITLSPYELDCSIAILIKLININDNRIVFDRNSLIYNITENNLVPLYVGRVSLIDIDRLFISQYEFYLKNFSSQISLDPITGSIILYEKLDREYHGSELQYDIFAIDINRKGNNVTNKLILYINDVNDHGPKFAQDFYYVNISKTLRSNAIVFQVNATSDDPVTNGNMSYYLTNSSNYFTIDQYIGIIRLKQSLSSMIRNFTLGIEVIEDGINLTARTNLFISIINDDNFYFNLENRNDCFLNENQSIGTMICTIGRNTQDFIYELNDKMNVFQMMENNGTIVSKQVFDYESDPHEYNVTIIVKDRENQSVPLSSLNLTIYLHNINDNHPEFLMKNLTTLVYFYHPSINTKLHTINVLDKDQSNLTFELLNNTFSSYKLQSTINTTEVILIEPILFDHEDNLIIRVWDNDTSSSYYLDLYLRLIYLQRQIDLPKIHPQTIDGYINLEDKFTAINFGQLMIENQSDYQFIHLNLFPNEYFSLKQLTNNQTDLYLNSLQQYSEQQKHQHLLQFQIELTVFAINQSVPKIDFSNNTIIYLPTNMNSSLKTHSIDIHLWAIDREMLDRTLSMIINLNPQSTYKEFIITSLPLIRETLAELVGVNIRHVHFYAFQLKTPHQIELLVAIIRYPSRLRPPRYIHKKLLYNALKNGTEILEKIPNIKSIERIFINQCHVKSCENNGRCTSHIKLFPNEYEYFYYNTYQRLIPKYQWNIKCLCLNHYYGQYCQFKQDYQSPCSSNPCSSLERCIEESSTLYTCQCIDEPCNYNEILSESTLDCININSPTCRDSSNTLTFDGYSFVRMNSSVNLTQHTNLSFTFRTQVSQGKLVKFISFDERKRQHTLIIEIIDSYINLELDKKLLFRINEITINDGLWHQIYFSIDYTPNNHHYYYLLRLDYVFSNTIQISQPIVFNQLKELFIGNDFHGCLGNLTLNNQTIYLQKQDKNPFLEHIGTTNGCQLAEIETRTLRQYTAKDDLCSLYHPCYHGGICSSQTTKQGLSFTCNCLKPRFTGRQCQRDLQPCDSHPCSFDEQCITSNYLNLSYSCISSLEHLPMSTKNLLYIGLAVTFCTLILFVLLFLSLIIYCQQQRKEKKRKMNLNHEKPLVSAPLLIQKSSPTTSNPIESPMQTLLKLNPNGKSTVVETMALVDNNHIPLKMNNFNDKQNNQQMERSSQSIEKHQSHESLNRRRSDPKYYSTIGKMNIPPDNFLTHYNSTDYDNTRIPLVEPQSPDLFDFPSSPTKYFNGHTDESSNNYQLHINSLSNIAEKLAEQNDIELTHSSNDSSNNEQTLLTSPISNGERKRSLFNGGSSNNIRTSTSSLQKAPVYAKIMKPSTKSSNGGMSTIERLRLSGSPLRLLSSSPTYARTTSFLKANSNHENDLVQTSSTKTNKINPTSWKLNPRKLDSLKARRNSRHTDDDDDENMNGINETSQLTTINRLRHASDSDLTREQKSGKKLSSFFQTEV